MSLKSQFSIQSENFSAEDIAQLVKIHRNEIKSGFLTSLGNNALSLLFSLAASSEQSILITVKDDVTGEQLGFLLGALNTAAFYKDFFKRKLLVAIWVVLPKVFSFSTVRKIIEVLLYPGKKDMQSFPEAELLDIAVTGNCQGRGLAKNLFYAFCEQLQQHGVREFKITTGEELAGAQRFYESLGAVKKTVIEVHKGQNTFVYLYKIPM